MTFLPVFLSSALLFFAAWSVGAVLLSSRKRFAPADLPEALRAARVYFWLLPAGLLASVWPQWEPVVTVALLELPEVAAPVQAAVAGTFFEYAAAAFPAIWLGIAVLLLTLDATRLLGWMRKIRAVGVVAPWPAHFADKAGKSRLFALTKPGFPACTFSGNPFSGIHNIFVPQALFADAQALDMVLRHELAHVHHVDFYHALVERIWSRLWWFWPPVAVLARHLSLLRELRCDLASAQPGQAQTYASLLLTQAQHQATPAVSPGLSTSAKQLTIRITMIRSEQRYQPAAGLRLFFPVFAALAVFACEQSVDITPEPKERGVVHVQAKSPVYPEVDTPPSIIGGTEALAESIVYPEGARMSRSEGRILVTFEVSETGIPSDIAVAKATRLDEAHTPFGDGRLEKAAKEAVAKLTFAPGIHQGKPVKVRMALPIVFRLPAKVTSAVYSRFDKRAPVKQDDC
jgi:TonB family protein